MVPEAVGEFFDFNFCFVRIGGIFPVGVKFRGLGKSSPYQGKHVTETTRKKQELQLLGKTEELKLHEKNRRVTKWRELQEHRAAERDLRCTSVCSHEMVVALSSSVPVYVHSLHTHQTHQAEALQATLGCTIDPLAQRATSRR